MILLDTDHVTLLKYPASERGVRLAQRLDALALFDERAADQFDLLRSAKSRLGTMDLKIAAIALVNQALLLSANRRDFEHVPGLRVEKGLEHVSLGG
ncbi:MAG TPA: type II toxin-antitoxin system VapC family toxin [Gemmataceae bacterium]|nr:type II toxin-antitoxin system VapC family toxin [Gemmataceae bacterium]